MKHTRNVLDGSFELDDCGENLFVQDVVAKLTRRFVGHHVRDRILRLEYDSERSQRLSHLFDVTESNAYRRPAKLDHISNFADADPIRHVVRLYFFGAAAVDASALVRDDGIAEGSPDYSRPGKLVGYYRGGWANIRL